MFSKKDIKSLANEAYSEFSKKHKFSCKISLIELNEFWRLAKKSKLVQDDIKKKLPLKIGALVVHKGKDIIYLNKDILNQITKDSNFIKAIVIHELYHVLLKKRIRENTLTEEIKSENRADRYIAKEFPKYSMYFV